MTKMTKFWKLTCILLVLQLCCLPLYAQQVSKEVAKEKALTFLSQSNKTRSASPNLVLANDRQEFFIFNDEANGGYVVVSGDERTPDVLGYSTDGHYDDQQVPCNQRALLDGYADQIAFLQVHPDYKVSTPQKTRGEVVEPLLGETAWGQHQPYNNMCPTIDGKNCLTGCVATAYSQIMYYHKWPESGKDNISYQWKSTGQTLSTDFSQSIYRWDLMTPTYNSNSSQESCDAVALLMHDVGYASRMDYGLGASSASTTHASIGLINFFDYDASMGHIDRDACNEETWNNFIVDDLTHGLPVQFSGRGESGGGGHAMVIDGYDGNGYFHFNFGWNGSSNDYYTFLTVPDYRYYQHITFGIKKNEGGKPRGFLYSVENFMYEPKSDRLSFNNISGGVVNGLTYYCALAIEDTVTHKIIYCDEGKRKFEFKMNKSLSDGDYILYPVFRTDEKDSWQKCLFSDYCQTFVDLNVKNGKKTYANNHIYHGAQNGRVEIDNVFYLLYDNNKEATITFNKSGEGAYKGDVTIPSKVSYGDRDYTVTAINDYAFAYSKLDRLVFDEGFLLSTIGSYAFRDCSIKSGELQLPAGLTNFDINALKGCDIIRLSLPSNLSSITGPSTSIAGPVDTEFLRTVIMKRSEPIALKTSPFGNLNLTLCTLYVPKGTVEKYKGTMVWWSFGNIIELGDIVTQAGIKYILDDNDNTACVISAFDKTQSEHAIPSVINHQGVDYQVTHIAPFAFVNCPVQKLTIPSTVEYIGEGAFNFDGLKLSKLFLPHQEPPKVADMTEKEQKGFYSLFHKNKNLKDIKLYVPVGCKAKYQSDSFWKQFTNIVEDGTVGIVRITTDPGAQDQEAIYTLSGVKVKESDVHSLPKGIYIKGNKKIVIK
jgi:hypothetical protein